MAVTATAPCRADLAGGTLDIWPLGMLHRGSLTVNVAIQVGVRLVVELGGASGRVAHAVGAGPWRDLEPGDATSDLTAAVCFTLRPRGGLQVRVVEQAPLGSGLGGSSTYAVALSRAVLTLEGRTIPDPALVALLRDLEAQVLATPTGVQDHWAAVCGGALAVHLEPGGERVERLAVDDGWLAARMSVFFTGMTHHSGMVNWQVIRRRIEGDAVTATALSAIADAARHCRTAVLGADARACGDAIAGEWAARKRLAPEVCPPEIEWIERLAIEAGALAVKGCGAGGGGSLLLWHPPEARERLAEALGREVPSGRMLPAGVAREGCRVREVSPEPLPSSVG